MGNCTAGGGVGVNEEDREKNRQIDKVLQQQRKVIDQELKILLLGAGDTGKSTLIKQIKLIYKTGFSDDEREIFRDVIATNILVWMHTLISAVKKLELKWELPENGEAADQIVNEIADQSLPSLEERFSILIRHREVFLALWKDSAVQEAFSQANSFQLGESSKYFFDNVSRIAVDDYKPNDEDILLARARTTGVVETTFQTDGRFFRILDVGGQRSERRKWIHCFEEVTTIIFFAALSEYNLALYEERGVNRMKESLKLFQEIVNCVWFKDTSVILFLNKCDLFRDKLAKYPLSEVFPDYTGGSNYQAGCEFVQKMYMMLNSTEGRPIYPHITCCTDTNQVRKLMTDVKEIFLRAAICDAFA